MEPMRIKSNDATQFYQCDLKAMESPFLQELIELIFSNLNEMEIEQTSCISKFWRAAFISRSKKGEFQTLKLFVDFAKKHLDDQYLEQKNELESVIRGTKIFNSINLSEVKSSTFDLGEKILHILKKIDSTNLKTLENKFENSGLIVPFKYLSSLISVYKEIDCIKSCPEKNVPENIQHMIRGLVLRDAIKKAFEYAQKENLEDYFFKTLLPHLEIYDLDRAFSHANTLIEVSFEKLEQHYEQEFIEKIITIYNLIADKLFSKPELFKSPSSRCHHFFKLGCRLIKYIASANIYIPPSNTHELGFIHNIHYTINSIIQLSMRLPHPLVHDLFLELQQTNQDMALLAARKLLYSDSDILKKLAGEYISDCISIR